jgi:phenylalanyl-tRNA synthetase beta chain
VHGYDRIPEEARMHASAARVAAPGLDAQRRARRILLGLGLTEVVTPALVDSSKEATLAEPSGFFAAPVAVRNPLSADRDALRGSLLPSLLEVLATNRARSTSDLAIFEVSRTYSLRAGGGVGEKTRAGILAAGKALTAPRAPHAQVRDFFDMKGLLEVYVEQFWGTRLRPGGDVPALLAPGASSAVTVDGERVGFFGEPARAVRRLWDLPTDLPVFLAELDLTARARADQPPVFRPLPRFPGATRDLAFVAPLAVRHEDLVREIGAAGEELLEECRLFDEYTGPPLGLGERSLAFTVVFRARPQPDERGSGRAGRADCGAGGQEPRRADPLNPESVAPLGGFGGSGASGRLGGQGRRVRVDRSRSPRRERDAARRDA